MSWQRFQRGVRALGNYSGGTSRLARPPAVLPEPDIRPSDAACTVEIHAASTGNTYSSPRAAVALDEAGMSNPCGLDISIETPSSVPFVLLVPEGHYSTVDAEFFWDGGLAEVILTVEDDVGVDLGFAINSSASSGATLGLTDIDIPSPSGRIYITAEFLGGATHTIDPSTVLTFTKT